MNRKEYMNEFQFTENLVGAMGTIISQKEGKDYLCFKTIYKIKEHKELVLSAPDPNHGSYGLPGYNGAEIRAITEKYGHLVEETIEEQRVPIIMIIEKDLFEILREKNIEITKVLLDELKITYSECYGTFNIKEFTEAFPCLNPFFNGLNKWREESGRTTIDEWIIDKELDRYLSDNNTLKEKINKKEKAIKHV